MLTECEELLTAQEAAEVLRVGHNAIYELLKSGELKGFRVGRVWKIPKEAVEEYIRSSAKLWRKNDEPRGR